MISTPKLTPLKDIERRRGDNLVSKIDINALENKIKAIESQIDQVKMIGGKRRLDALEQSLNDTQNFEQDLQLTPLGDTSLLDDQDNDLENFMAPEAFETSFNLNEKKEV